MTISTRLDYQIENKLSELARLTGRTKTYYIREAVPEKLDDLEDIYYAESRAENPGKIRSIADVEAELVRRVSK